MTVEGGELSERWLAVELNGVWLRAERTLRAMQVAGVRPAPTHPAIAEVEGALTVRRAARLGQAAAGTLEDDAALTYAITECERELGELRRAAPLGRLI